MGLLFGLLTSLSIGGSDLFGRRVMASHGAVVTGAAIQFVAIVTSLAAVTVVPSDFDAGDLLLGLASGVGLGLGLLWYFTGLDTSSSAVVAPLVGTLSAVLPYVYAVVRGAAPTGLAVGGALVALVGIAGITMGGGRARAAHIAAGVRWGVASGLAYGFGLSVAVDVSDASGSWPAVGQRITAFVMMVAIVRVRRLRLMPRRGLRGVAAISGVFAGLSTVFFLLGLDADPAPAIVAASLFPAVTVVVGRWVYGDDVAVRQVAGIGLVILGVIGVGVG